MKNKVNSVYDILKIILAIMVVLIHGNIFPNILYPWLRIAVPLFFVMSSYFLFSKLNKEKDNQKKKIIIKSFVLRNLKLYLIWFIILLPITLEIKKYFVDYSFFKGLIILLRDFIFSSTFCSSWFIIALIEGCIILYFCSKKISNKLLLIGSFVIYLFITIISTYTFIIPDNKIIYYFKMIIPAPCNSFLVSFMWMMIGKMFAEKKINYGYKTNTIIFIISGILLFIEWIFVKNKTNIFTFDCYILLIPFVISIYWFVSNIKPFYYEYSIMLRNISTVMYTTHKSIIYIFNNYIVIGNKYVVFILVILSCILLTFNVNYLSKYWLKFLKNAY